MIEKEIKYRVKNPANEKEVSLEIRSVVPACEDDLVELLYVGNSRCVHDDFGSYFYQCPNCKNIEITDYPFGHIIQGIEDPDSKWERIPPTLSPN